MRNGLMITGLLLASITSAQAQVSVGIGLPGVSIGINVPVYPQLVEVPGYPVYYAPGLNSNYFFYDGMYWVYQRDNWYASTWYNGPWGLVSPQAVPLYVLRIPVRYYRQPPVYFRGWQADAPPRWGDHWGGAWQQSHGGWDNWNRGSVPAYAPLPVYQRQYSGNHYPGAQQQQVIQTRSYQYQPQEQVVQQRYQSQRAQGAPSGQWQPAPVRAGPQQMQPPQQQQVQPQQPQPQQRQGWAQQPQAQQPQAQPQPQQVPPQRQSYTPQQQPQPQAQAAPQAQPQQAPPPQRQARAPAQPQPAPPQHEEKPPKPDEHDKGAQGKPAKEPKQDKQDNGDAKGGEHGK